MVDSPSSIIAKASRYCLFVWPILLLSALASAPSAARTYLASIKGVRLGPDEFVTGFSVDTWGVTYGAVCRIPPGWYVKAGGTAAPDGRFEGEGTQGITYLTQARLNELNGLVLIALDGPVRPRQTSTARITMPATFDGKLTIGSFASSARRSVRIVAANIQLAPASRCSTPTSDGKRTR